MAQAKRDQNRVTTLLGVSSTDSLTPVAIEADATTKGLNVQIVGDDVGIGGGTQYDEGDTSATLTGNIQMAEGPSDTATPLQVDAAKHLQVDIAADSVGIGGGTQYDEDDAAASPATGNALLMERDDALAGVTPAEGDWIKMHGTAEGALWVQDFNSDAILADTANIDTNIASIEGTVDGTELQVDVVAALPAGDNNIGNVDIASAIPAGDNNIGNVDIVSLPAGNLGQQLSAASLSITPATDIADGTYIGDINFGEALPAGTNAIGKLAANDGVDIGDVTINNAGGVEVVQATAADLNVTEASASAILEDTAIMSGWDNGASDGASVSGDVAHDSADAGEPVKFGGRAQSSEAQPDEVADNDRVDALFDRNGYLRVRGDFDPSYADINDASSGDNTIIAAAGAGKRIAVWSVMIVSDGTVDVRFEDGAGGTAFTGQIPLQEREGFSYSAGGIVPLWVGSANTLLNLELSAAVNVHGHVSYTVIDD